jgi:membrane fusion protein (multidrug efflux system)
MRMPFSRLIVTLLFVACAAGGCDKKKPAPPAQGPAEVGIITLEEKPVVLTTELPGRTTPYRVAEVRARVNGIVLKRHFTEGADVKEGDPLFDIDPAPFEAALQSARAAAARASATAANAKTQAARTAKMLEGGVGTQIEADNASAAQKVAEADVASAQAALQTATINLGYTKIKAPISGRIGRAAVTEGAYVQASPASLLATIQQLDQMYVDLTWSNAEVQRLKRDIESGKLKSREGQAEVKLMLEGDAEYAETGKLQFADVTVDANTGSISLRALFPNPKGGLLPGMFVRARLEEGTKPNAILVPQKGVTRDGKGKATALIVNAESKVERRELVTDRVIGDSWLVVDGLKAGDRVIVEGLQRARPDSEVVPVPAQEKKQAAR